MPGSYRPNHEPEVIASVTILKTVLDDAFPVADPLRPAPSASVTILKAFFNDDFPATDPLDIESPVE